MKDGIERTYNNITLLFAEEHDLHLPTMLRILKHHPELEAKVLKDPPEITGEDLAFMRAEGTRLYDEDLEKHEIMGRWFHQPTHFMQQATRYFPSAHIENIDVSVFREMDTKTEEEQHDFMLKLLKKFDSVESMLDFFYDNETDCLYN